MKKNIVYILCVAIMLCMFITACGKDDSKVMDDSYEENVQENESEESKEEFIDEDDEAVDISEWGFWDRYAISRSPFSRIQFRVPSAATRSCGTGRAALQADNTILFMKGGNYEEGTEVQVDEILEEQMDDLIYIVSQHRGAFYSDLSFEIESEEIVTINGYQMCRYTGNHKYLREGLAFEAEFDAYSMYLSTGSYLFWVVLDNYSEPSGFVAENARNIAYSIVEEERPF